MWRNSTNFISSFLKTEITGMKITMRVVSGSVFLARRAYATMSVSVCDGSSTGSRCMPGRREGSSRAMLATARPSCTSVVFDRYEGPFFVAYQNLTGRGC